MGWTDLYRVAAIGGDVRGSNGVYVLLPDETVANVAAEHGAYETCSVQECPDWDEQYAEPLWNTVVWVRFAMSEMRKCTRALRTSDEQKWQALKAFVESEGFDTSMTVVASLIPDQYEEIGEFVTADRRRFKFEIPYKENRISRWEEAPPDMERYPRSYQAYHHACWLLDAAEGKTSDWIFSRPYDWKDKITPGWNPPFLRPTFATAEEAALLMLVKGVVRVTSVAPTSENTVEIGLEVDEDPSGQFPKTVTCEQLPNGRWRQAPR